MSIYPIFEEYCKMIIQHGGEVTYTKEEYKLKYRDPIEFEPMIITPRNQKRPMKATFENSEKISAPKKPKAQRAPKISSEQSKKNRLDRQAKRRADFKAQGLTAKGTIPKPRKKGMTKKQMAEYKAQKMREQREIWKEQGLNNKGQPFARNNKAKKLEYAKTYQANHREKHLEYRRKWRKDNKEKINSKRRVAANSTCILQEAS